MRRRAFLAGLGSIAAGGAAARNARATAGATFTLDGAEYRLADILAPETAAYADAAKRRLQQLLDAPFSVVEVAEPDRWNRRVVRVLSVPGSGSFAEMLLADGVVRVRPETDEKAIHNRYFASEESSRRGAHGLWADARYRIRPAADAWDAIGHFHLVDGVVVATAKVGGRLYVNFGEDFREDFTATAPSRLAGRWAKDGLDLLALKGERVRVRGYVAAINGPSIELDHPRQIEILARGDS